MVPNASPDASSPPRAACPGRTRRIGRMPAAPRKHALYGQELERRDLGD
jgi:hypothetical protein